MDLYQTGIIVTFFLIIAGSMAGAISQMEPEENFGITSGFATVTTSTGVVTDVNGMVNQINNDFIAAFSSSNPLTQLATGGNVILNSALFVGQMIVSGLTNWLTLVDLLFVFAIGTPLILIAVPIKIVLGVLMLYTLFKFIGDIVSHLPFFGGGA